MEVMKGISPRNKGTVGWLARSRDIEFSERRNQNEFLR